ncbi:hypothetical protein [Nesterenkonia pannonica]|uniref:hypothetical protein n=1 Tax=Nesterenkonia pannonica TaxID=1548602 RepID=UPI0021647965|nr:hypothetical protein [Nesterenkonia pannonica]
MSDQQSNELIILRSPTVADGADLWRLAEGTGVLDTNTPTPICCGRGTSPRRP